ncbi:UNVERIFIED_CONTAM: Cyclin-dependent kinase B1-1 [Siphonaria sp. JEL0065]|nr:Cyclin-dependent kinase B1-1 [Siphonaria sp. JEL0065]
MVLQQITEEAKADEFPFVVRLHEHAKDQTHAMLVLDYCAQSLDNFIALNRPIRMDIVQNIVYQLTLAVAYINEQGFMHRDLKPQNIMVTFVTEKIMIRVIDFGLSRVAPIPVRPMSPVAQTMSYRAPEMFFQPTDEFQMRT